MTVLDFFLAGIAKDFILFVTFYRRRKLRQQDQNLREWPLRRGTPGIDWYLRRRGGYPSTRFERVRSRLLPHAARWFVNLRTFDLLLGYLLNRNSRRGRPAAKNGKAGVRRFWPRIKLVS